MKPRIAQRYVYGTRTRLRAFTLDGTPMPVTDAADAGTAKVWAELPSFASLPPIRFTTDAASLAEFDAVASEPEDVLCPGELLRVEGTVAEHVRLLRCAGATESTVSATLSAATTCARAGLSDVDAQEVVLRAALAGLDMNDSTGPAVRLLVAAALSDELAAAAEAAVSALREAAAGLDTELAALHRDDTEVAVRARADAAAARDAVFSDADRVELDGLDARIEVLSERAETARVNLGVCNDHVLAVTERAAKVRDGAVRDANRGVARERASLTRRRLAEAATSWGSKRSTTVADAAAALDARVADAVAAAEARFAREVAPAERARRAARRSVETHDADVAAATARRGELTKMRELSVVTYDATLDSWAGRIDAHFERRCAELAAESAALVNEAARVEARVEVAAGVLNELLGDDLVRCSTAPDRPAVS